jgi:hypothetical protein
MAPNLDPNWKWVNVPERDVMDIKSLALAVSENSGEQRRTFCNGFQSGNTSERLLAEIVMQESLHFSYP